MYLWFSFAMFLLGGFFAMVIRAELFQPGMQLVEPGFFQSDDHAARLDHGVWGDHAVFRWLGQLADTDDDRGAGYGAASDEQLELLDSPACVFDAGLDLVYGRWAPAFGWTFYAPLSTTYAPPSVTFFIFCDSHSGCVFDHGLDQHYRHGNEHARAWHDLHEDAAMFVWTWLITAFLLVAVMPVLAGAVTMMLMDIHFGTSFFSAAGGGDPVLFQHISGSSDTPRSTSLSCPPLAWCRRSFLRSRASRCLVMIPWCTPQPLSRSCPSLSGRTTCIRWVCQWRVSCSLCTPPC